jgi:phage/plasmid-like protein (TIGR03299 family)
MNATHATERDTDMTDLPKLDAPSAYDIAEKSNETFEWLRNNVRVGYTTQRGPSWWAADQESPLADGTHFDGPIPQDEVDKILGVPLVEAPIFAQLPNGDVIKDPNRKAILRGDDILYVPSVNYQIHPYRETLDKFVRQITDDEAAGVASVGLLQNGGIAFLQAVLPESYEVGGYGYQPYVTGVTSVNGKRSTTYLTGGKATICDNTLNMALAGAVTKIKYKHTKNSRPRVATVREALGIQLVRVAEDLGTAIKDLQDIDVSDKAWEQFLDVHVPMPEMKSPDKPGRGWTLAENKRNALDRLYLRDPKVSPWNGTAFGVVQAVNTWRTWEGTVRKATGGRLERNLTNDVTEAGSKEDLKVLDDLSSVLDRTLSFA